MGLVRRGGIEWKRVLCILIALSPLPVCLFGYLRYPRFIEGQNDFLGTYIGIRLISTGRMYDPALHYTMQRQLVSIEIPEILYTRPPYHALLLAPLGLLPYRTAFWAFEAASLLALAGFLYLFQRRMQHLPWWCAASLPVLLLLLNGQDDAFLLLLFAVALELMRRRKDLLAGAVLALCAYKFHLFLLVPVALLMHRRWHVIAGGAAGGLALGALSFAVCPRWPWQMAAVVASPNVHVSSRLMGNLEALSLSFPHAQPWLLVGGYLAVGTAFLWIAKRERDTETVLGWSLAGGLLVSIHTWPHDLVLLLAAVPLMIARWPVLPRRGVQALLLLPVLPLALLDGRTAFLFPSALLLTMLCGVAALGTKPERRELLRPAG